MPTHTPSLTCTQPHSLLAWGSLCTAMDMLKNRGITFFMSLQLIIVGALPVAEGGSVRRREAGGEQAGVGGSGGEVMQVGGGAGEEGGREGGKEAGVGKGRGDSYGWRRWHPSDGEWAGWPLLIDPQLMPPAQALSSAA